MKKKKVGPKLRQEIEVKVDIVTSDDIKIYYTGKFQDFTARYILKRFNTTRGQCLLKALCPDPGQCSIDTIRGLRDFSFCGHDLPPFSFAMSKNPTQIVSLALISREIEKSYSHLLCSQIIFFMV